MYPVSNEFKSTAETSLNGLEVVAYREGGGENEGNYWEKDITEWVIGVSEVKNAIHSQRGGYAASISPTLTITVLQSDEVDALIKDLGAGTLKIRVSTYNFLEDAGGGVGGEKVLLFDGLLLKQDTYNRDVYGKVYELTFAHPLIVYDKLGKIDLGILPDPYDWYEMDNLQGSSGKFGRRDLLAVFKSLETLISGFYGAEAPLNIDLYNDESVKLWHGYDFTLQETHTPIYRKKNGTTFVDSEYLILGSDVENFVKVRGVAYNESEEILIVGIDDLQMDYGTREVTHTPRLCYLQFEGGFLRMEHVPVKLWYTGEWKYRCPSGYRILDLHYDSNTDKIYFVVETAQDDLDDKIDGEDTGIYFEGNQFRMRTEGGDQGEKSPRIYFGEVDWADRKDAIQFNHTKRLKKYHKGIHIYSRHTEWSSTTNIDDPRGIEPGAWRGIHYSQMIGSGTPETEKSLGVPLPYNRLVATSTEEIGVGQNVFLVELHLPQAWTNPDFEALDYLTEGSHMYVTMVDKDPENEFAIKGNICYLGDIVKVVPAGLNTYEVTTRKYSLFKYVPIDELKIRFIIIPDFDHPYDNIPIPEYSSLEVVYNDGPDWFQYPWTTKKEINVESRRELQQRINFFFKKNVDTLSESTSYEPDPGLYSFSANAEVEGFSGYRGTFLAPKPSNWGYWNPTGQWTKKTIEDGTWTSAKPIPFHLVYKFIDDSNQFKWRYHDGNIQRFAVCNNNNDKGLLNPDAGRPNVNQPHFKSLLVVYYNGAWRPVELENGGYLKSYGNMWLSLDENNVLWIFTNDFEKASWPVSSQTAIEWFNTCKIYKWKDDTNYSAGGFARNIFRDRIPNESLGREYFFNYIGTNQYTLEENQPQRPPRLFTGPGVFESAFDDSVRGGRKTLMYNRNNTGIKVLGAYHVELGYDAEDRPGVAGIKGYSGGVQPVLVLEGDVSEKFDVGDTIELRHSEDSKNNGEPNPKYAPHVTYQILDVETMTINFLDAPKIMKGEYNDDKETVNQGDENNYRKFGFWTLVTIESLDLKSYPQYSDPDIVQLSVLQACVEKNIITQSEQGTGPGEGGIVVNLAGNILRIDNTENYYYIYKVGKKWEFADQYAIYTGGTLQNKIEDFQEWALVLDGQYNNVHQTRLWGETYKFDDGTELGEVLTPKVTDEYNKLPFVTLSEKKFNYFIWLREINEYGENYRTVYARKYFITIKLRESKKVLATRLIFDDSDIKEPDLTTVLVKPNTGNDLTECRLIFNRDMEGIEVLVDYRFFLDGFYDGFEGNRYGYITNSKDKPSYKFQTHSSGTVDGEITTQTGVIGTPTYCGPFEEIGDRRAMISRPDNNLMILDNKWTGYIEEINASTKRVWNFISNLAITNNCYVIPDSARYNDKTGSNNPMNITFYPRTFKGVTFSVVNPTKIKKVSRDEYDMVVVNYKHGKAIVEVDRDGLIQVMFQQKGNKYEVSCEYISEYNHAVTIAATILQWLYFGVEYELNLGYLASWLQVLDSVKFKTNETNEEGIEVEVWEDAYITSVNHKIGQEGNGTTTLKVISYTDSQGEPFNPGNPEYKEEPA